MPHTYKCPDDDSECVPPIWRVFRIRIDSKCKTYRSIDHASFTNTNHVPQEFGRIRKSLRLFVRDFRYVNGCARNAIPCVHFVDGGNAYLRIVSPHNSRHRIGQRPE